MSQNCNFTPLYFNGFHIFKGTVTVIQWVSLKHLTSIPEDFIENIWSLKGFDTRVIYKNNTGKCLVAISGFDSSFE